MKRFLLFAVAVLAFVGCNNAFEDEHSARLEQNVLPTLTAGFEDATRTYVENGTYLHWHEGDLLTAFYGNTLNRKYKFNGKTGDNSGSFKHIPSGDLETGNAFDCIYAIYPYQADASITDDNIINYSLPAEQEYAEASFGKDANTMVAVTENLEDTFLGFKNACGYLKIKLYGEGTVKSIELKGNNGEKIAGAATITMAYGETPQLTMATDATKSITLNCGEGVALSNNANNPTEFWVVVPPTTFNKGITVTVTDLLYGAVFEQSTSNKVVVERNQIQPMAAVAVEFEEVAKPANNEIWYTAYEKVVPYYDDEFGATLLSNTYNSTTQEGILTFKSDVTQIGYQAFYLCTNLTSVTIPDSVTTIGDYAFYNCTSLTSVTIPDGVTTIGERAFSWCWDLTSVTIPDSVTTIGEKAFYNCGHLRSVTIGNGVTAIGEGAFSECTYLTRLYITDLAAWCRIIFSSMSSNPLYRISTMYLKEECITDFVIPDGVTSIGDYVFCGLCGGITSVTIPDSVTTITEKTFYNCRNLTEFKGKFASDDGRCLIIDRVLNSFAPAGLTEYTIPNSVTAIGNYAFGGCTSLTSLTIPDSVTTIGESAFSDCSKLKYVYSKPTIPPSLGGLIFYYCDNIKTIYVPTGSVEAYKTTNYWKNYADKIQGYDF